MVLTVLLLMSTPVIRVTEETVQVGRAQIERKWIGEVEAYRGEDATQQRGPALNAHRVPVHPGLDQSGREDGNH